MMHCFLLHFRPNPLKIYTNIHPDLVLPFLLTTTSLLLQPLMAMLEQARVKKGSTPHLPQNNGQAPFPLTTFLLLQHPHESRLLQRERVLESFDQARVIFKMHRLQRLLQLPHHSPNILALHLDKCHSHLFPRRNNRSSLVLTNGPRR